MLAIVELAILEKIQSFFDKKKEYSFTLVDLFFFFSSRRRHTRLQGDWSSDVCSSDLTVFGLNALSWRAVEPAVVYSIARQESAFNPKTVSSAKALGLMQVTPEAGRDRKSVV